jgi:hypothetical protein
MAAPVDRSTMSTQKPSSKETTVNYQRYLGPAMVGVGAFAVLAALGVPVVTFLPFLIFLACPLMMVFMMRGMDHGGGGGHAGCHGEHGSHESHQHGDQPADTSATPGAK